MKELNLNRWFYIPSDINRAQALPHELTEPL